MKNHKIFFVIAAHLKLKISNVLNRNFCAVHKYVYDSKHMLIQAEKIYLDWKIPFVVTFFEYGYGFLSSN